MGKDAYGNEVIDPFDLAIAQGVMRATWGSAIFAAALNLAMGCCIGAALAPAIGFGLAIGGSLTLLLGLISMGSAVNVAIRVLTMQPDHKALVPSWHPWGALGLAVAGAAVAGLQMLLVCAMFAMPYAFGASQPEPVPAEAAE